MRAEALSRKPGHVGAVAFSRTGDPAIGEFGDAKVIRKFGEVPEDLSDHRRRSSAPETVPGVKSVGPKRARAGAIPGAGTSFQRQINPLCHFQLPESARRLET
jgi:hypothetical protein